MIMFTNMKKVFNCRNLQILFKNKTRLGNAFCFSGEYNKPLNVTIRKHIYWYNTTYKKKLSLTIDI